MRDILRTLFPPIDDYEVRIFAWFMLALGVYLAAITGIYLLTA